MKKAPPDLLAQNVLDFVTEGEIIKLTHFPPSFQASSGEYLFLCALQKIGEEDA